jgi:hypothetical protein
VQITKSTIANVSGAATKDLSDNLLEKVPGAARAAALRGESRGARLSRLFELVSGDAVQRMARILDIMDAMRRELPDILARSPLKLSHFGFARFDDLVQYIGEALVHMETSAETRAAFVRGVEGWRWNLVGRVLFERLVKYHPRLDTFFRSVANDLVELVNREVAAAKRGLVGLTGSRPAVTPTFGTARKVMEFRLIGADGVERAFTDFGFLTRNREGWWVMLPIEIKMPGALAKVAEQFSEFLPRLEKAQQLIALVEHDGAIVRQKIPPEKLLFMQHDQTQVAVAPLSKRAGEKLLASGRSVPAADVASVIEFTPKGSATHGLQHYRIRLLVLRDWLEDLVRPITDPPKR